MENSTVICRTEGWHTAWIDDELVMMHADSSVYLSLSGSGGRIWELLETARSVADLCRALALEYNITADAARPEVVLFLEQLRKRNAISVYPAALA